MFNPRRLVIAVGLALLVGVTASCSSVDDKDVQSSQTATALPQAYGIPPAKSPACKMIFMTMSILII